MKQIQLTNSTKVALVDDEDFDKVVKYQWYEEEHSHTSYAVSTQPVPGTQTRLHRFVMELEHGDPNHVDHKNGQGLECWKDNLRLCTHAQNLANSRHLPGVTGFRGVGKSREKFAAKITVNFKQIYLGVYDTAEEAAKAYDRAAIEHFGEFARPNFPQYEAEA